MGICGCYEGEGLGRLRDIPEEHWAGSQGTVCRAASISNHIGDILADHGSEDGSYLINRT
jgi:hypothetical protein